MRDVDSGRVAVEDLIEAHAKGLDAKSERVVLLVTALAELDTAVPKCRLNRLKAHAEIMQYVAELREGLHHEWNLESWRLLYRAYRTFNLSKPPFRFDTETLRAAQPAMTLHELFERVASPSLLTRSEAHAVLCQLLGTIIRPGLTISQERAHRRLMLTPAV